MIIIVEYGMGNLCSVEKALVKIGVKFKISNKKEDLERATHIIIPGVGSFNKGIKNLSKLGLIEILKKEILEKKKPFLGICLGMQLLFKRSEEGGIIKGLGYINGDVKRFHFESGQPKKVPHIGWNDVFGSDLSLIPLFKDIEQYSNFYFVHSYHAVLHEKILWGNTDYGYNFVSLVQKENIFGVQFHPEKSQQKGLKILKNFIEIPWRKSNA